MQNDNRSQAVDDSIPTFLTREETAKWLRISLPTLHKLTSRGLPSRRHGKRRVYVPDEVLKYFKIGKK